MCSWPGWSCRPAAALTLPIAAARSIFFYTVRGTLRVNGTETKALQLVEFNHDGDELTLAATSRAVVLLGHALPFGEPVVSAGPFVMNTEAEIQQAYRDYQQRRVWHLERVALKKMFAQKLTSAPVFRVEGCCKPRRCRYWAAGALLLICDSLMQQPYPFPLF